MLNAHAEKLLAGANFSKNFCRPLYDSYCFSALPGTVAKLLGAESKHPALPAEAVGGKYETFDVVLLFLIDGFGFRFFEKYVSKYPFLKRFLDEGVVSKITSQFPSTTAAHVTNICTGLEVGQSGMYEWFYYEPKVDGVIAPLLFSFAGDGRPETLRAAGVDATELYPKRTFFEELHDKGVASFVMQELSIAHSTYSQMMLRGGKLLPYTTLNQAAKSIIEICEEAKDKPHYIYFYLDDIDAMGHRHGVDSREYEEMVDRFWSSWEELLWKKLAKQNKKIACLFVADHGMVEVNPASTIYLNQLFPDLEKQLKKNRKGEAIVPAGSCRDFFLHVNEDAFSDVQQMLQAELKGKAEVYPTSELIKNGFFGLQKPAEIFYQRVGNLVVLPYAQEAIWWYKKNRFEQHFYGAHGGLTRQEMEIPFGFITI